jgi:aspartate-semialdehyde dehydrogenase
MGSGKRVAVLGATGVVGGEMLSTLEQRNFPVAEIKFLASARSAGKKLTFRGESFPVEEVSAEAFRGIDIVLSSAGASTSREWLPKAVEAGAVCIDNTSFFRMDPNVPLVVPEVNGRRAFDHQGIIANPNCSTIQMVVALEPIRKAAGIKRIVVATYQSTSGAGKAAMDELYDQTKAIFSQQEVVCRKFPHQIAFNVIPQIDVFLENGYTKEEMKMVLETQKIMEDPTIMISATTVRVPVFYGHSESVNVELLSPLSVNEARELLAGAPGIKVWDDPSTHRYPLAIEAAGTDEVWVGRLRKDISVANGLEMWIVADNIRKGAALNAVQIAELLVAGKA